MTTNESIGMVTHFVYDGMLLHVVGNASSVREAMNKAVNDFNETGAMMFSMPVVGNSGQVKDLTFSLAGSIVIMDEHDYEGPEASPWPKDASASVSL